MEVAKIKEISPATDVIKEVQSLASEAEKPLIAVILRQRFRKHVVSVAHTFAILHPAPNEARQPSRASWNSNKCYRKFLNQAAKSVTLVFVDDECCFA